MYSYNIEYVETIKEFSNKNFSTVGTKESVNYKDFHANWKKIISTGLLKLPISYGYDGLNENMLTTALCFKELAKKCSDEGLLVSLVTHMCSCVMPIYLHGSKNQKENYLNKLISGEFIGGNGMTEANGGSDVSNMKTFVVENEDSYILNGSKVFVTNGTLANLLIIYGRHRQGMKHLDTSAFLVETNVPGFSIGQIWEKMGLHSSPTSEIVLNNVEIPLLAILGRKRRGLEIFTTSMSWERIIISAYHLGAMERQFNQSLEFAKMRKLSNKAIIQNQDISSKLIDMKMNIDVGNLLLKEVCNNYDVNRFNMSEASVLKLHASTSKVENSLRALQIFGASGYMKDTPVEQQVRNSLASTIYAGTSEIQKKIISENFEYY